MAEEIFVKRLSMNKIYSISELYKIYQTVDPGINKSTFQWNLYDLLKRKIIYRIGYDTYTISSSDHLSEYRPVYSDTANNIMNYLQKKFDGVEFVIFESVQLNEFLNHQIAQNTIYIQVEKDISSYIFDALRDRYKYNMLYKPNEKEFLKYWSKDMIVVLNLISQAPLSKQFPHEMTSEKLLVDILADKSISATFSPAELPSIYDSFKESYLIDRHRLSRYAKRRGKIKEINKFIGG